jgi:hypothetical protein
VLIAIAVVIGFVLLAWGFDGGDADAGAAAGTDTTTTAPGDDSTTTVPGDDSTTTVPGDDSTTTLPDDGTPTTTPTVVDPPSSVTVQVLNGTGEGGLAGTRGETLGALGYIWKAGNAAGTPVAESKVYFVTGFGDEAGEVAAALSGPASVLELAPADLAALATTDYAEDTAAADVIVVLGADNALS